jgi:tetratricopeptide (TPR) repeat protein
LTWEARTQEELSTAWGETLKALEALVTFPKNTDAQEDAAHQRFVEWSIDFAQAATSQVGINTTVAQLNHVRKHLGQRIGPSAFSQPADAQKRLGDFLCLRAKCSRAMASLLRRRGRVSKDTKSKIEKNKNQALHDAERAHTTLQNEKSILELALCLFSRSGTPGNENAKRAMELLKSSVQEGAGPLTRYELVKQYRLRYQFRAAIQQFTEITDYDTRRFHSNVTHFAAAVIGLHYEKSDPEEIKQYALIALPWIEELISQDRHNARDLVDLCYLKAISGWPPENCITPLEHLKPMSTSTWDNLAGMAKKVAEGDVGNALLLGLEDPVIWSRIGSFYAEFLQDYPVAVEFYDRASHIAPLSPVFHFNKAEALAYGLDDYTAAKASFEYAMRLKNRSYAWYKSIPDKIQRLSSEISSHLNGK